MREGSWPDHSKTTRSKPPSLLKDSIIELERLAALQVSNRMCFDIGNQNLKPLNPIKKGLYNGSIGEKIWILS
jgi:hypothetical protein